MPRSMRAPRLLSFLLIACLTPAALPAQGPGLGPASEVGWAGGVRLGALHAVDRIVPMGALSGVFRLSPRFEVGGEGVLALRSVRVSPDGSPDRSELSLGYGGLLLRYGLPPGNAARGIRPAALIGAGRARVESPLVETDIGSENFLLIEPSVEVFLPFAPRFRPTLNAGYRMVLGADDLPGVRPAQLRGVTLSLTLNLVRDP
jgi:hypothetical protein